MGKSPVDRMGPWGKMAPIQERSSSSTWIWQPVIMFHIGIKASNHMEVFQNNNEEEGRDRVWLPPQALLPLLLDTPLI